MIWKMDTYLFSFYISGLFKWSCFPPKQAYKIVGITASYLLIKGNQEGGVLQLKILAPHDAFISSLSYFMEHKSVSLYIVCPYTQRVDVLASSSTYTRSLRENGVLFREFDLIQFMTLWRDRIVHLPDSALDCSQVIHNSCDILLVSDAPPRDEKKAYGTVGVTPEFFTFGLFDQEYNYVMQTFTRLNPCDLPKSKGNRTSLIILPQGAPVSESFDILREMSKRLDAIAPPPTDGRRIKCTLVLDEEAPPVDVRLLTPVNLDQIGILVMSPEQYFQWISASELKFSTLESSVDLRSGIYKSIMDYRFAPAPFMYQWRNFVFSSQTRLQGTYPHSDWSCIIINSSALDFLTRSLSFSTLGQIRRTLYFKGAGRFEYYAPLERSLFRTKFRQEMHVMVYPCEVVHAYEKTLEKSLKDRPLDQFMASMGFLRVNDVRGDVWSEKLFNIKIRKSGHFIYSDFIEDCFDGFALENAKKIVSSPPECCVCCTNAVDTLLEGCGHSYCNVCLSTMLESIPVSEFRQGRQMADCPSCRCTFSKESFIQFKAYKTTRRKSKEDGLSRKKALHMILNKGFGSPPKQSSSLELDMESEEEPKYFIDHSGDPSNTLLIIPFSAVLSKVMDWFPGNHCVCLDSATLEIPESHKYSRIVMLSPFMEIGGTILERLHTLLQSRTTAKFTLEILSLTYGSHFSAAEDFAWTRSMGEAYGEYKQTISGIMI